MVLCDEDAVSDTEPSSDGFTSDEDYAAGPGSSSNSDVSECSKERTRIVPEPWHNVECDNIAGSRSNKLINKDLIAHTSSFSDDGRATTGTLPNPKASCTPKNHCYVCKKLLSKIAWHLKKHENEEPDIAAAFLFPKNSKERKQMLENLQNRGNYQHNQEVMESHSGPLKLKRRPRRSNVSLNAKSYAYSVYCKGMTQSHVPDTDATGKAKV